jgi:hydrogenase maturation protease
MSVLVVAIGNELRGDDAVAYRVVERIEPSAPAHIRRQQQLTPETASELAPYDAVIFLDADPSAAAPVFDRVQPLATAPLSHSLSAGSVVLLARSLYGWRGDAWLCRLPAREFTPGAPLSGEAESHVPPAALMVRGFLEKQCTSPR